MNRLKPQLLHICITLSVAIHSATYSQAQAPVINIATIEKILNDQSLVNRVRLDSLTMEIYNSGNAQAILRELEAKSTNSLSRAFLYAIKATVVYLEDVRPELEKMEPRLSANAKPVMMNLWTKAMQEAYMSGDDRLIAYISLLYGQRCFTIKELEFAMMYTINGLELNEKIGVENKPIDYLVAGELLYKIREYRESAKYSLKAFKIWEQDTKQKDSLRMMWTSNTTALAYHRMQQYDSAFIWYEKAMQLAQDLKLNVWTGIVSGNMGQIYFEQRQFDKALSLLHTDYTISKKNELYDNAANSLQWTARTQLQMGNKTAALQQVREAFSLLAHTPDMHYLRNAYFTATEIFKAMGEYDSAFYYNKKYSALNDSLERVVALSGIAVSKARANDEKSRYSIQSLQKEKEKQLLQRNILITAIILLGIVGFLATTRQRLKAKLQVERVELEKKQMEQEIILAREQLTMFTENIVEKTSLIEKLEQKVQNKEVPAEQQLLINEISQRTILTEEDWIKFKSLFEKIYPSFFQLLKQRSVDITVAEQRMAALTRLQLTTKQMAAMLGISVDSVHKTRQRLRQRLQLGNDTNLDEFIRTV